MINMSNNTKIPYLTLIHIEEIKLLIMHRLLKLINNLLYANKIQFILG